MTIETKHFHAHVPKTQPTAVSTLHVVAMHVPETNIPLKCHMYATKETNTCADMKPPCQYICLK